ncbi:hypothetical protein Cgig2_018765 [Carnegiea gigantea]|uniref:Small ribosomal subunit protein eS4 central region domain-containing protein n=1 Tax=Carnegiea gigantea TaxID=171969 RepID=A0A9Q1GT23_9CARY|nr:hypothetical protein Cgig2_018765 [Carnegiea gigantea]
MAPTPFRSRSNFHKARDGWKEVSGGDDGDGAYVTTKEEHGTKRNASEKSKNTGQECHFTGTNERFHLLYDIKGRFPLYLIRDEEAKVYKFCYTLFDKEGIPHLKMYHGCTISYPDPLIKANDIIKLDLESNKIVNFIKFDMDNVVMVVGGWNNGRVGIISLANS